MRNKAIYTAICAILAFGIGTAKAATVSFAGNSLKVLQDQPSKDTGLDMIYVAYGLDGVTMTFSDPGVNDRSKWYRYGNLGGGYAEEITDVVYESGKMTIESPQGDMGYFVEYGDSRRYYFWLTDYSAHRLNLKGISAAEEQSCDNTLLNLDFSGDAIKYFTITGQQRYLDQQIEVSFTNLVWNDEDKTFDAEDTVKSFEYPKEELSIYPPVLAQTFFTVSGDRFLKQWNWGQTVESASFYPVAVDAHTEAIQTNIDEPSDEGPGSNIMHGGGDGLGGSAPADITFKAYISEGVLHNEWQLTRDPSFDSIDYRFNVQDLDYTFNEEGTFYLRYVGSNSDGTCEAISETYVVNIGASDIKCPNAFSPGVSPGVNDEWKVSYRSIVKFKCWIFNRNGVQMCYFDDPSLGWDGTYGGKVVSPGVYYYVIEAMGADGKKYKLSGDINVIGYRQRQEASSGEAGGGEVPQE